MAKLMKAEEIRPGMTVLNLEEKKASWTEVLKTEPDMTSGSYTLTLNDGRAMSAWAEERLTVR